MVADHPAEPTHLVALVGEVIADVGRSHHGDSQRLGVSPGVGRGPLHGGNGPLGDLRVGQLEYKAVGLPAAEIEGLRPVGGHPHGKRAAIAPREGLSGAVVLGGTALGQVLDDPHGLLKGGQIAGLATDDPHC